MSEVPLYTQSMGHAAGHCTRIVRWFRGGLVFKAHRLSYYSTLGSRVIKKKSIIRFDADMRGGAHGRSAGGARGGPRGA